ncbi:MAG: nuclear transport factor 2 family protein [Candidatus Dadabacteria bacterium]
MPNAEELSDYYEISQVVQVYGKALDEKRFGLLGKVFSKDAELIYLLGENVIRFKQEEAEDLFKSFLVKCYWSCHLISAPVVEINGDSAYSTCRVTATHIQVYEDGLRNIWIVSGAYEDDFVREAAGWRIKRRVVNAPYEEGHFVSEGVKEFPEAPRVPGVER